MWFIKIYIDSVYNIDSEYIDSVYIDSEYIDSEYIDNVCINVTFKCLMMTHR